MLLELNGAFVPAILNMSREAALQAGLRILESGVNTREPTQEPVPEPVIKQEAPSEHEPDSKARRNMKFRFTGFIYPLV